MHSPHLSSAEFTTWEGGLRVVGAVNGGALPQSCGGRVADGYIHIAGARLSACQVPTCVAASRPSLQRVCMPTTQPVLPLASVTPARSTPLHSTLRCCRFRSDWHQTFASLAGVAIDPSGPRTLDSLNVWPHIESCGARPTPRTTVLHHYGSPDSGASRGLVASSLCATTHPLHTRLYLYF